MSKTGRPCRACNHPKRGRLEEALRTRDDRANIAAEFDLSVDGLRRHLAHSRPPQERPAVAQEGRQEARGGATGPSGSPADVARLLTLRALKVAAEADEAGAPRVALSASRVARELVETAIKARAIEPPPYDPLRDEVLAALRDRLSRTLAGFPEALEAVRRDFEELVGVER